MKGWNYVFGQFASQSLPFSDSVTLMVLREGETEPDTFTVSNPKLFHAEVNLSSIPADSILLPYFSFGRGLDR